MHNSSTKLPIPDAVALAHSNKLLQLIKQEILQHNGIVSFARFMELALYAPGLGYYSAGAQKIGKAGDFVTAPEISPLFSRCVARQCQQILTELQGGDILEFGAGSGVMAAEIMLELERLDSLPIHYYILEVSADLQQKQQQNLQKLIPHLFERVVWLSALPAEPLQGVILANEVLDAMPAHRFALENNNIWELGVSWQDEQLVEQKVKPLNQKLLQAVLDLQKEISGNVKNYISEVNLILADWIKSVSEKLQKGLILLLDYGFPRSEYYHPDRNMGTLMCHYRHYAHAEPFWLPGLQDITVHVDFTAVAEAAHAADLTIKGYATQAAFLLSSGLLDLAKTVAKESLVEQLTMSQQIQKLTAPHEMGELFKVIALGKDIERPLLGFTLQDLRTRL